MARPIVVINTEQERIVQTPSRIRCQWKLSNGQILTVRFTMGRAKQKLTQDVIRKVWVVSAHVGNDRKQERKWIRGKRDNNISTGTCGIEALSVARDYVLRFCEYMSFYSEVQIAWSDKRRARAYRFLLRYAGFSLAKTIDGKECIIGRNPEFWERKGDREGENKD